jgi:hypothetical protein
MVKERLTAAAPAFPAPKRARTGHVDMILPFGKKEVRVLEQGNRVRQIRQAFII